MSCGFQRSSIGDDGSNNMKGYLQTLRDRVHSNWIDYNGHMNIMWYMNIFDRCSDILTQKLGLSGKDAPENEITLVAGRIYIAHRKELLENDEFEIWSGLTSISDRGFTISHRAVKNGRIHATCDINANAFSRNYRNSIRLEPGVLKIAEAYIIPGMKDRFADEAL